MSPHTVEEDSEPLTGYTTNSNDQLDYTPSDGRYYDRNSNSDENNQQQHHHDRSNNNQRPRVDRQTSSSSSRVRRFLDGANDGLDTLGISSSSNNDGLARFLESSGLGKIDPRILLTLWFIFVVTLIGLMIGFRSKIFGLLESLASFIKGLGAFGPPFLMFCLFATTFPPMIGYSSIITMTGYVYGFLFGFAIAFTSALAGSIVCFYFCRRWFKPQVRKLMAKNKSLKSVVRTVEKRGFRLLVLIRLAPYPFNIMNALLSATHIPLWTYALATGMSLLKLTLHVYIGSTLSSLNEDDSPDNSDPNNPDKKHGGKALKVFIMVVSILFGIVIGLYVWIVAKREIAIVEASRLDRRRRRRREHNRRSGLNANTNNGIELSDHIPGVDLGSRGLSLDQGSRRQGSGELSDLVGGFRTDYRNEDDDGHEDQSLFGLISGGNQQRQAQDDSWRNVGANIDSSTESDDSDFLDDDDDDDDEEYEVGHDYGADMDVLERGNSFLGGNRANNYRDVAQDDDEDDEGALDFSAHHIGLVDSPWRDDDDDNDGQVVGRGI